MTQALEDLLEALEDVDAATREEAAKALAPSRTPEYRRLDQRLRRRILVRPRTWGMRACQTWRLPGGGGPDRTIQ